MSKPTDTNSSDPSRDGYIAALKVELAGYVAAGRDDRAADVRAELERVGAGDEPARTKRAPIERAVAEAPEVAEPVKRRASRPKPKG